MFLAIEIGGTKLQLAVGNAESDSLLQLERRDVYPEHGAEGIRKQIAQTAPGLISAHGVRSIGIGFGGPVDPYNGKIIRSYHVEGWVDYPLKAWCEQSLGIPSYLGNDSDLAGLGEANFGAGKGSQVVFYSNVGTGIGGALVIDGQLYLGGSGGAGEIGHFRPSIQADTPDQIIESHSSGWGMTAVVRHRLEHPHSGDAPWISDILQRCDGKPENLTAKILAAAFSEGNALAADVFEQGIRMYGWALAQAITLLGPNVVVIGGGVPLVGETFYLAPLRQQIDRYVMEPRRDTYEVKPAALGEEVVLHGALALARTMS